MHYLTRFFYSKSSKSFLLWMKGSRCVFLGSTCRSLPHQFTGEGDNSQSLPLLLTGCSQSSICLFLEERLKPFSCSLHDSQNELQYLGEYRIISFQSQTNLLLVMPSQGQSAPAFTRSHTEHSPPLLWSAPK